MINYDSCITTLYKCLDSALTAIIMILVVSTLVNEMAYLPLIDS